MDTRKCGACDKSKKDKTKRKIGRRTGVRLLEDLSELSTSVEEIREETNKLFELCLDLREDPSTRNRGKETS